MFLNLNRDFMIQIRYKELASGKYSVYLDIYTKDLNGHSRRQYDFLGIYVSCDYNKVKRIKDEDKEKIRRANAIKAKRELETIDVTHGLPRTKETSKIDLFFAIEQILKKEFDANLRSALKYLKIFANRSKLPIGDIDDNFIDDFWKYLSNQIAHNTAITYFKRLRSYINKAIKSKILSNNPFKEYQLPSIQEVEREVLSFNEIQKLQNTKTNFNPVIRQAFLFSCFSGLRFSDIRNLTWDNIKDNQIVIKQKKTFEKTGKIFYYPLSEQAKIILSEMEHYQSDDKVFSDFPTNSHVNLKLKEWASSAGIDKNLSFHTSRHTFGTLGISSGIDLYSMQKLLGHAKIEMTQHYAKIVNEKLRADVMKFPTLKKLM